MTEITEIQSLPLTTTKYHVGNLLDAGLISVAETKYSIKGRQVKIYSLTNQLLIGAPRQSNVRALLLASLFCIVVLGTMGIAFIVPYLQVGAATINSMNAHCLQQCSPQGNSRKQHWHFSSEDRWLSLYF